MRRFAAILVLAGALALPAWAAMTFPALTGRVVDNAHLLSPQAQEQLTHQLASLEAQTADQLVVVTVPDLGGREIEEYGYQLGRYWGIGQKGKNNGALLIIAPKQHKIRIEVGYGLEGTLTDAQSNAIIQSVMLPQFKQGRMEQGILAGTDALVEVLNGKPLPPSQPQVKTYQTGGNGGIILVLFLLILFSQIALFAVYVVGRILGAVFSLFGFQGLTNAMARMRSHIYPADKALLLWLLTPSVRLGGVGSRGFGSDSDGGGFSGGGGSFGGGGSSGSW